MIGVYHSQVFSQTPNAKAMAIYGKNRYTCALVKKSLTNLSTTLEHCVN